MTPTHDRGALVAEVSALLARYCRAVDDQDAAMLRGILTDDVRLVAADGTVTATATEFVAFFERFWAGASGPGFHMVVNVEVLDDPDPDGSFAVHAYFHAFMPGRDGSTTSSYGRYRDTVVRGTDGSLRLAAKRIEPAGLVRHA